MIGLVCKLVALDILLLYYRIIDCFPLVPSAIPLKPRLFGTLSIQPLLLSIILFLSSLPTVVYLQSTRYARALLTIPAVYRYRALLSKSVFNNPFASLLFNLQDLLSLGAFSNTSNFLCSSHPPQNSSSCIFLVKPLYTLYTRSRPV